MRKRGNDLECGNCLKALERQYLVKDFRILQRNMSIEEAKTAISNCVYNTACIIEALEGLGIYHGNGHHAAQDISQFAVERFMKGVINKDKENK